MESFFNSLINIPSDFIWKYLFYILIGLGLFFTLRFGLSNSVILLKCSE